MKRTEIVRLAMREAQAHSFEKVSMQDLADKLGVKKPSFYYHFSSKQSLAVATIEEAISLLEAYFEANSSKTISEQMAVYIQVFTLHMQPIKNLCPGLGFVAAWSSQTDDVQRAIKQLYASHLGHLTQLIESGIAEKTYCPSLDAKSTAKTLFSMLQGGLLCARVEESLQVFDGISSAINMILGGTPTCQS